MSNYKHGTYGEFADSIGEVAALGGTVAVYVGAAPVNLVRGFADSVNSPVKLTSFNDVRRYMGYSENWAAFDLCEAFHVHFNNAAGSIGPIVAINVLDPETHRKAEATKKTLSFINGRATIASDTIILDTLVLAEKVEGTDFSIDYDYTKGQVIIDSIGEKITGNVEATYNEVDHTAIKSTDIIGGVTAEGVYSGLGCVGLIYQELGLVPNLLCCPKWSSTKTVYDAMIVASTKINGHWEAFVFADIPVMDGATAVATVADAIEWKNENGYTYERSKVCWPQAADNAGHVFHAAVLGAWRAMLTDASHDGVPMETPSNKAVPVVKQYFSATSKSRGFDLQQANELNANGITTVVYWGGRWVLWGPHTAAYKFGAVTDNRNIFDNSIRMMMHTLNSFHLDHALTIDQPMTLAMADTIKQREQEKADGLAAIGAYIGIPVVEFRESENSTGDLVEGNFTWGFKGTPTPPFKNGLLNVAYTTAGFNSYFGEV